MSEYKIGQEVWALKMDGLKPKAVRGILIGISDKAITKNGKIVGQETHYTIQIIAVSANGEKLGYEIGFVCVGNTLDDLLTYSVRPFFNNLFRLAEAEINSLQKGDAE